MVRGRKNPIFAIQDDFQLSMNGNSTDKWKTYEEERAENNKFVSNANSNLKVTTFGISYFAFFPGT